MAKLIAICTSEDKGMKKTPAASAVLKENHGIEGDAHAGNWHRQVSLLGLEKIEEFRNRGADVEFGAFGENLVVEGIRLSSLPVGTKLSIGDTVIEITQIGKECHSRCAIYEMVGDCIMPREGVFAKVLSGGMIQPGDEIELKDRESFTFARITMSDKGAAGEREDESGPLIDRMMEEAGYEMIESVMVPDEYDMIVSELMRLADQRRVNIILTTGGTGFSPRDVTPEATEEVCERMAPGIAEAIRAYSMTKTPRAMLSRAVSGIRGQSLIINLPGSPKAVEECLEFILPVLGHGVEILTGRTSDCAR